MHVFYSSRQQKENSSSFLHSPICPTSAAFIIIHHLFLAVAWNRFETRIVGIVFEFLP
jgi:hypothetical protein